MLADPGLLAESVASALGAAERPLLRFITCGSVDDGKSTLIGRLLHDCGALTDDQLATLAAESQRFGMPAGELDYSLLLDGLAAEREQKITIDVAYRYFSTDRRKFIIADTPGHEQYTRNMITGASTADAAVILVDARRGVVTQTRRHGYLVALLGLRHVAIAINKLDLLDYSREAFDRIADAYREFAESMGLPEPAFIPVSATRGDNVATASARTPWYRGPTLLDWLETVEIAASDRDRPLRMPVQWINRPDQDFRGFSGRLAAGSVRPGDRVRVLPSGKESVVARIVTQDGDLPCAVAGQSVTLTLTDEIDVSRGDCICDASRPAGAADEFEATLVWMGDQEMLPGRPYLLKSGSKTVGVSVASPKYKINVNTFEHLAARTLQQNDIGVVNLNLDRRIAFDPYRENRDTGSFILIDRWTNDTVGAGLLHFALRRSQNVHWQSLAVDKEAHVRQMGHRPCVLWFTGLSGAGKSTIANLVERKLHARGAHSCLLDGDNVRHGLNKDLGFTAADRVENISRVAEVARLMVGAGLIVLVSFISPFRAERRMARALLEEGEFVEVFVDAPLALAEERDPKGLYRKARAGALANFTGIDSPYEAPEHPEIRIDTAECAAEDAAAMIVGYLDERGILPA